VIELHRHQGGSEASETTPPHIAFIEQCERTFDEVFGVAFKGPMTCLSCGARQLADGSLPCGH